MIKESTNTEDIIAIELKTLSTPLKDNDPTQDSLTPRKQSLFKANIGIFLAWIASILYGTNNYFLAYVSSIPTNHRSHIALQGFSFFICFLLYHLIVGIRNKQQKGYIWRREQSRLFPPSGLHKTNFLIITARGVLVCIMNVEVSLVIFYSQQAHISPASILSITTMATFTTALLFYIVHKEKLNKRHIIGMLVIVTSVITVSLSKQFAKSENDIEEIEFEKVLIPLGLVIVTACTFTLPTILPRIAVKNGYSLFQFTADSAAITGIIGILAYLYLISQTDEVFTTTEVILYITGGFIFFNASILFNAAFKFGKGGIIMAIIQTQSIYQLIYEILIDMRVPNIFEISAMIMAIIGAVVIASAKK